MDYFIRLLLLTLLASGFSRADQCQDEPKDERVYTFRLSGGRVGLSYIDEDGEMKGIFWDVVKMICGIMNKKCTYVVGGRGTCWDDRNTSIGLNNRWFDGCVGLTQTAARRSGYAFMAEFTNLPGAFLFVKKGSAITTIEDISHSDMGFTRGISLTPNCLERELGISLNGKIKEDYERSSDVAEGILNGEVEAMLGYPGLIAQEHLLERLDTGPIYCSLGGLAIMVRKDMVREMAWMDEGLQKLKENGDYQWRCNIFKKASGITTFC